MTGRYGDTSVGEKKDKSVRHIVQTLKHATTPHAHCMLASRSPHDSHETLHSLHETILARNGWNLLMHGYSLLHVLETLTNV